MTSIISNTQTNKDGYYTRLTLQTIIGYTQSS